MKQFFGLLFAFFTLSFVTNAQVFWTEDFGAGACNQGQLAPDYAGANGTWTVTQTGTNGDLANVWYISAQEQGGQGDGGCGVSCGGDMNNTLHVGNIEFTFFGNTFPADPGAAYGATGGLIAGSSAETDVRAESPTIDCTGKSSITLSFLYLEGLNGDDADPINDNADVWYFDGVTWALLDDPAKTPNTCSPQGTWTTYSVALPASADNNANVKIGFHWINNDDLSASDPSFAVDDITLSEPSANLPVALFGAIPNTICATDVIAMIDDQSTSDGTITTWTWDFDGGVADLSDPANPINVSWTQVGEHTITLTVTDENGTSEPYSATITVEDCSPVADISISPAGICAGESISFTNNSTYSGPPPSITWAWTFGNGNTSSDQNPADETYLTEGSYEIQLIATDGYGADTATATLTVLDCSIPNALFTASDTTICANTDVTFTDASVASSGATINDWQWTFDGGTPSSFNGQNPGTVTYNTPGTWTATLVVTDDINGTSNPYTQNIEVTACATTEVVIQVPDTSICIGDCLNFTDGSTGQNISGWDWTFNGGSITSSNQQNPGEICYNSSGDFSTVLTITDDNGTTSDSLTIHVNASPTINLSASSTTLCSGQSVTLVATGGGDNITWDQGVVDGEPFIPASLGNNTYTATITNDITGCSNSDEITITVDNCVAPVAQFGSSSNEICVGDCVDITDLSSDADTLFWDFGAQANPSSYVGMPQENIQVCFDTTGTYTITQTAVNAIATDVITHEIIVHDRPSLVIPNDTYTVSYGNSVTISANSFDDVTYSWTPPQNLEGPFTQSPTATPTSVDGSEVYTVTIIDENNCTATANITVEIEYTLGLGIPNAFSPEATPPNNTFGPLGFGFEVHRFIIYNRYGQKVFEANEAGQLWDGTMNGKRLNSGTFFWTLDYEFTGESRKTTSGQVSLIH